MWFSCSSTVIPDGNTFIMSLCTIPTFILFFAQTDGLSVDLSLTRTPQSAGSTETAMLVYSPPTPHTHTGCHIHLTYFNVLLTSQHFRGQVTYIYAMLYSYSCHNVRSYSGSSLQQRFWHTCYISLHSWMYCGGFTKEEPHHQHHSLRKSECSWSL